MIKRLVQERLFWIALAMLAGSLLWRSAYGDTSERASEDITVDPDRAASAGGGAANRHSGGGGAGTFMGFDPRDGKYYYSPLLVTTRPAERVDDGNNREKPVEKNVEHSAFVKGFIEGISALGDPDGLEMLGRLTSLWAICFLVIMPLIWLVLLIFRGRG